MAIDVRQISFVNDVHELDNRTIQHKESQVQSKEIIVNFAKMSHISSYTKAQSKAAAQEEPQARARSYRRGA